jgi:splicing factor 3B subunit 3
MTPMLTTLPSIFQIPKLGTKLKEDVLPLSYTPRKLIQHPANRFMYLIEGDHRTWSEELVKQKAAELVRRMVCSAGCVLMHMVAGGGKERTGRPDGAFSCRLWTAASTARHVGVVHPDRRPRRGESSAYAPSTCSSLTLHQTKTVAVIPIDNNESAFSVAVVPFAARGGELHLVVGTAQDTIVAPRSCTSGFLRTYRFVADGAGLELVHKTETEDVPLAVLAFQGRLVAGVGKALRIYDMGKKKLLRKVENKVRAHVASAERGAGADDPAGQTFNSPIVTLATQGSRIVVGAMQESISYAVYKAPENRLLVFADDMQPRWTTAACMVDYNTVAGGDRFGNVFVNRLDAKVSDQVDEDPTGAGILHEKGTLMGAPHKTRMLAHFHVGDVVTSITKAALVAGGREVLVYAGLHGTLGALVPFASKDDVDFISTLEQHMRTELAAFGLVGRDHLSWRGYHVPVKAVVDGDLCEAFAGLPAGKQSAIAGELDRTVGEVLKKLEQLRVTASGF